MGGQYLNHIARHRLAQQACRQAIKVLSVVDPHQRRLARSGGRAPLGEIPGHQPRNVSRHDAGGGTEGCEHGELMILRRFACQKSVDPATLAELGLYQLTGKAGLADSRWALQEDVLARHERGGEAIPLTFTIDVALRHGPAFQPFEFVVGDRKWRVATSTKQVG